MVMVPRSMSSPGLNSTVRSPLGVETLTFPPLNARISFCGGTSAVHHTGSTPLRATLKRNVAIGDSYLRVRMGCQSPRDLPWPKLSKMGLDGRSQTFVHPPVYSDRQGHHTSEVGRCQAFPRPDPHEIN